MTYAAILALVAVAALLFQARGVIGVILADAKMRAGDYDGALRRLHWASLGSPNAVLLHKEGLILSLAGRPALAEPCYRGALDMVQRGSPYPRERLHVSLGYALIDLGRYDEAEACFHRAIEAGDRSGNSQDGLAELRLVRGVEIEQALAYTGQAIEHAKERADGRFPGSYYALQAWALALLGRGEEAREALAQAMRVPETNARTRASLHWRAGMALGAIQQAAEARKQFQMGHDLDPRGKYGRRCGEHLS
jgi:tetratricopeptide (TPR) repeat protein